MKNTIYLDTNILIYLLEKHKNYSKNVATILDTYSKKGYLFLSSVITVTEFLAGTISASLDTLHQVPRFCLINLNEDLAQKAAVLQKNNHMQIGDAIHLATAIEQKTELFFTNDKILANIVKNYMSVIEINQQ